MTQPLTCPHGHSFRSESIRAARCPVCGGDLTPSPSSTDPTTVHTTPGEAAPAPSAAEHQTVTFSAAPSAHSDEALGTDYGDSTNDPSPHQGEPPKAPVGAVTVPGYEIVGELGRGGMGVVYKARHVRLQRVVALKMILAGAHASEEDLTRFRTEAESIARLQHPHIVQIHEIGDHDGLPYFSLEFCSGGSLDRRLDGTPWAPGEAAALVCTLARAMAVAHQKGVIHRDLKPGNILLTEDGTAKITDFGLARKIDEAGLTHTGSIVGSPSYMSPEQACGSKGIGPATDIYALGSILYQLLTGKPPFKGPTLLDTLEQVRVLEPLPPTRLQARLPRDLETVCLKCLHKSPGRRYASASELADDLERFLNGEPVRARPVGRTERMLRWIRRHPAVAALAAALVLITLAAAGLVVRQWREAVAQRDQAHREAAAKEEARADAVTQRNQARQEAKAKEEARAHAEKAQGEAVRAGARAEQERDAATLALARERAARYVSRVAEAHRLLLERRPEEALLALGGCPEDLHGWEWHYLQQRVQETRPRFLHGATRYGPPPAFSPDGSLVAFVGPQEQQVEVRAAASGQRLHSLPISKGAVSQLLFSPDGQRLIAAVNAAQAQGPGRAALAVGEVVIWDAKTGEKRLTLRKPGERFAALGYSPLGRLVALGREGLRLKVWDVEADKTLPGFDATQNLYTTAFSGDGRLLAVAPVQRLVELRDAATGQIRQRLPSPGGFVHDLAFSPDGKRLATVRNADRETSELKVWDCASGKLLLTLTEPAAHLGGRPHFSADGKYLAASINRSAPAEEDVQGEVKVWEVPSGRLALTFHPPAGELGHAALSPDGRYLVVLRNSSPPGRIFPSDVLLWDQSLLAGGGRTLSGPVSNVTQAALSADGSRLAAGSDKTVQLWDARSGQLLNDLTEHTGRVGCVVFRPDGKRLASGDDAGTIKIWGPGQDKSLRTLKAFNHPVAGLAFHPDGSALASAGRDGTVRLWDAETGRLLRTLDLPREAAGGSFRAVAFSPDGQLLAASTAAEAEGRGMVLFWDAKSGKEIRRLGAHAGAASCLAFEPGRGRYLATAGSDRLVKLWDARTGKLRRLMSGHTGAVTGLAFSPDGRRLFTVATDRRLRIWDTATGEELLALTLDSPAGSVACGGDGSLVALSRDRGVNLLSARPGPATSVYPAQPSGVGGLALQGDGSRLATATCGRHNRVTHQMTEPGEVRVWDTRMQRQTLVLPLASIDERVGLSFAPDGTRLAAVGWNPAVRRSEVRILDPDTGERIRTLLPPRNPRRPSSQDVFSRAVYSPKGDVLAVAVSPLEFREPGAVEVRDAATGTPRRRLEGPRGTVTCVAFSPDGKRLAAGSRDFSVHVWDLETGQTVHVLNGHSDGVNAVAFSPDGRRLASGGADEVIRLWEVDSGKELRRLVGHDGTVSDLAFSPDGRLASASWDHTIKIWDADRGSCLQTLHGHGDRVSGLAFSSDGRRLYTASHDRTVRVWEVARLLRGGGK